jgi:hypothetical protein
MRMTDHKGLGESNNALSEFRSALVCLTLHRLLKEATLTPDGFQ